MNQKQQPISKVEWVERTKLIPNNYNPNKVAPPELKLLKISILSDGWTQPIVVNEDYSIVDGFHRYTISGDKEILKMTNGLVPVVMLQNKSKADKQMSTIRHNRARGTHGVLPMAEIIHTLFKEGLTTTQIMQKLQMEKEEVTRLLWKKGIAESDILQDKNYSKSWEPDL
jgi:ParB-like chromosome segregation protein Spo0J